MQKTFTFTALLFTVMFFASIENKASDYALSVKDGQSACSRTNMEWVSFCSGYIQAVANSYSSNEFSSGQSATKTKMVTFVRVFFEKNPKHQTGGAFGQITKILSLRSPC